MVDIASNEERDGGGEENASWDGDPLPESISCRRHLDRLDVHAGKGFGKMIAEGSKIVIEVASGYKSLRRFLVKAPVNGLTQRRRQFSLERGWFLADNRREGVDRSLSLESTGA